MKLIGITGSCGKTSVAEIVYQYLIYCGYNTSLYCSNGLFVNGLTREKDFFQTTLYRKDLDNFLKLDEENEVEYAIIEITAESIKRSDTVHLLPFDVLALTSFYGNLHNHFNNQEDYYLCKRTILTAGNVKKLLLRMEEDNYSMFSDLNHISYGYTDRAKHKIDVLENNIDGLRLSFQNVSFTTNLITGYHVRNISSALAILAELDILNMEKFKSFSNNIKIRGRFEKIIIGTKNIIIDTGFAGAAMLLSGIEHTLGNSNYRVVYSSVHYNHNNEWVKKSRKRAAKYLQRSNFLYLTNPSDSLDEEEIFINDILCDENIIKYKYIPDIEQACNMALNELQDGETLIIFSREYYREYRRSLDKIINNLI